MATLSNNDIAQAIYLASKDKGSGEQHEIHGKIIQFLAKRRLMSKANDILRKLREIVDKEEGVVRAKVSTAATLATQVNHNLKHSLMKRYGAKEVVIDEVVDKKLIGGLKIEIGDEVIDLSIKNRINKLQTHLTTTYE